MEKEDNVVIYELTHKELFDGFYRQPSYRPDLCVKKAPPISSETLIYKYL